MLARPSRPISIAMYVAVFALTFGLGHSRADAATDTYIIDKGHSSLNFKISHLGISYTYGRFNDFTGSFTWDAASPGGCAMELDITTDSIDTNDDGRDKHLRKADFFNCEKYPSMTFKSTKIEKVNDKTFRVTGNLTLLAVTKEITIRMEKIGEGKGPYGNYRMGFDGSVMIKRSDFGMKHSLPHVGDEVYLTLGIEGIKHTADAKKK